MSFFVLDMYCFLSLYFFYIGFHLVHRLKESIHLCRLSCGSLIQRLPNFLQISDQAQFYLYNFMTYLQIWGLFSSEDYHAILYLKIFTYAVYCVFFSDDEVSVGLFKLCPLVLYTRFIRFLSRSSLSNHAVIFILKFNFIYFPTTYQTLKRILKRKCHPAPRSFSFPFYCVLSFIRYFM